MMDTTLDAAPGTRAETTVETPIETLARVMPVATVPFILPQRTGLIIVDEVNGFCTVGCGPLAPAVPNAQVERMIEETDRMARFFLDTGRPVMVFRDTHVPGRAEPPYPPHCEVGTGQEELVPALEWLVGSKGVSLLNKDCINGVVGGIEGSGGNVVFDWIMESKLEAVVFVGICTDICVLDAVTTLLSARNHHVDGKPMLGSLLHVVVYEPGCATYDLPVETAIALGLPETSGHPQALSHHVGLAVMQARGAVIASTVA